MAEQPSLEPPQAVIWRLRREIEADLPSVWRQLEQLDTELKDTGLPVEQVNRVILILEELLTNIVKYGNAGESSQPVMLSVSRDSLGMVLGIVSAGQPFDPHRTKPDAVSRTLEDQEIGGLGLILVNDLADGLQYRHEAGWNHVEVRLVVPRG